MDQNLNNVHNVSFGLKRLMVVIIWLVFVNFSFVIVVVECINNVHVIIIKINGS